MLELIRQLVQTWAVRWLIRKLEKLEKKVENTRNKLDKKITPEQQTQYDYYSGDE